MRGLVLDLRDDPGGYVDAAVDVCDLLIPSGVIVTVRRRGGHISRTYAASGQARFTDFPMAVLINDQSRQRGRDRGRLSPGRSSAVLARLDVVLAYRGSYCIRARADRCQDGCMVIWPRAGIGGPAAMIELPPTAELIVAPSLSGHRISGDEAEAGSGRMTPMSSAGP